MKWYKLTAAKFSKENEPKYSYYLVKGTTIVFKFSRDWIFQQLVPTNRINYKIIPQSYLDNGILEVFYYTGNIINVPVNRTSSYYFGAYDILYINKKKLEELTKNCNKKQTIVDTTLYNLIY